MTAQLLLASADADASAPAAADTAPQHTHQVALLFLTHGDLPHDLTWTAWMREARGLLPRGSLAGPDAFCLKQCDASGAQWCLGGGAGYDCSVGCCPSGARQVLLGPVPATAREWV